MTQRFPFFTLSFLSFSKKGSRSFEKEVSTAEGQAYADSLGAGFIEVSATTGEGIEDMFHQIAALAGLTIPPGE